MIEFEHKLPSMNIGGKHNGTYNNREMVLPCILTTTDHHLGDFLHGLHNIIHDDRRLVFIDGKTLVCSNNWIRDFVHQMKGFKHWEYDLKSFIQFIIDTQREDGQYYELIKQLDDCHWKYVDEDCRVIYPDDNVALVRLELEADVEYLVVEGAMNVYSATGDLSWLVSNLPKLEKGIEYITSSPKRWSKKHGLVIRPYTIDTWDFTSSMESGTDRRIHDGDIMCAMHGDNSGVYQAMIFLAKINTKIGNTQKADEWLRRASVLREAIFRYLWNGKFFVHQLPVNGSPLDDKESIRLSLSNPYDINRGITDQARSRSIIEEYMERRKTTAAFAEWFSVDPPYPQFKEYNAGSYVNGGISPFTAGELAKAAFRNGYEDYGWDILSRFIGLMERDGDIYFLYHPTEQKYENTSGPSAWGAAALMSAVDEGLAGITDRDCLYREINFSPRFPVTQYRELRYITGYEVSHTFLDLRWIMKDSGMRYDLRGKTQTVHSHILLPRDKSCSELLINGKSFEFTVSFIGESEYIDFDANMKDCISMEILF